MEEGRKGEGWKEGGREQGRGMEEDCKGKFGRGKEGGREGARERYGGREQGRGLEEVSKIEFWGLAQT